MFRNRLRVHFLGLFWKENLRQNGNDQNYWNMIQEKMIALKIDWDLTAGSSSWEGELKFAADVLMFWSAILLLRSDYQLFNFAHSVHSAPKSRIQGKA